MDNRAPAQLQQQQTELPTASDESLAIQVILNQFWRDGDKRVQAVETAAWLRTLAGMKVKDILSSWERYQGYGPKQNNGALIKPTAIQIRDGVRASMPRLPELPEPPRDVISAEAANAIMDRAGFTPKRLAAIRGNPMANSFLEAEMPRWEKPHWTETADPDGPQMRELRRARDADPNIQWARKNQKGD